jgi:hypothetical protein
LVLFNLRRKVVFLLDHHFEEKHEPVFAVLLSFAYDATLGGYPNGKQYPWTPIRTCLCTVIRAKPAVCPKVLSDNPVV